MPLYLPLCDKKIRGRHFQNHFHFVEYLCHFRNFSAVSTITLLSNFRCNFIFWWWYNCGNGTFLYWEKIPALYIPEQGYFMTWQTYIIRQRPTSITNIFVKQCGVFFYPLPSSSPYCVWNCVIKIWKYKSLHPSPSLPTHFMKMPLHHIWL